MDSMRNACDLLRKIQRFCNVFSATRNVSYPAGKVHIGGARIQMKFAGVFAVDSAMFIWFPSKMQSRNTMNHVVLRCESWGQQYCVFPQEK